MLLQFAAVQPGNRAMWGQLCESHFLSSQQLVVSYMVDDLCLKQLNKKQKTVRSGMIAAFAEYSTLCTATLL